MDYLIERKKLRREEKERNRQEEEQKNSQPQSQQMEKSGQGNMAKGKRGNSRGNDAAHGANNVAASIEADLNIPSDLKEIVNDPNDDFPLRFRDHNELIDIFSTLEENNLLEIQRMQESE